MPYPALVDDGTNVELDLHGARVEEARRLTAAVLREAFERGRATVRIIHGHSTSGGPAATGTIKHVVRGIVDYPPPGVEIVDVWRAEGAVTVSLPVGRPVRRERLQLRDVWPT